MNNIQKAAMISHWVSFGINTCIRQLYECWASLKHQTSALIKSQVIFQWTMVQEIKVKVFFLSQVKLWKIPPSIITTRSYLFQIITAKNNLHVVTHILNGFLKELVPLDFQNQVVLHTPMMCLHLWASLVLNCEIWKCVAPT